MIKPKKNISKMWRPEPETFSRKDFFRFDRNERTSLLKTDEFSSLISTLSPYEITHTKAMVSHPER